MPAIGVPLRKWTLALLLLCSVQPTWAESQATNDVSKPHDDATAPSSTTTPGSSSSLVVRSSTPPRPYADAEATCPFRTINYITHTLPQQCAKTSWAALAEREAASVTADVEATPSSRGEVDRDGGDGTATLEGRVAASMPAVEEKTGEEKVASGTIQEHPEGELETDSPLDNANFLSFEDWKKRNLAQVGQSPENVGQGRAAPSNQPARRRPVNVNALDSLGEEAEIELDFSGFGNPEGHEQGETQARGSQEGASTATDTEKKAAPSSWALSKDAGKTCKERFNYASFDCAATVLKTNKQAKSATSVLVENKDSYMLNVCSASNKFFIVELCDDILVDTVVLANYEFFSSMFRHFRVSVSDRYPVKMERWRTLATFEARNSRDIQPFLITEPQIWARYLRIEFLTHYGNEFYCPLSLLRVHGTTMMEQFRREEEEARGVDDDVDLDVVEDVVKPAIDSGPIPPEEVPVVVNEGKEPEVPVMDPVVDSNVSSVAPSPATDTERPSSTSEMSSTSTPTSSSTTTETPETHDMPPPINGTLITVQGPAQQEPKPPSGNAAADSQTDTSVEQSPPPGTQATTSDSVKNATVPANVQNRNVPSQVVNDTVPPKKVKSASNSTASNNPSPPQQRPSGTSPTPPAPSTQESFFKSIHKRLLYLEANSTLSLQYIEEQSRILRDAFVKVEKRQLAKTEKFLDHLNSTVMQELKSFRLMYDQLWQSTVIEIESMKERQKSEMTELGSRLSLMADELVWQKRMAVVQSTLLLLCLGLVLFVRSGTLGGNADVPIVQQLGNKYSSFFDASSPPRSPPDSHITRRRRTFRNIWRSDTSLGLSDAHSDGNHVVSDADADTDGARSPVAIEYSPPTPTTPAALAAHDVRNGVLTNGTPDDPDDDTDPASDASQAKRLEVLETQSGPATPNGTRDSRPSWEEVDRAIDALKAEEDGAKAPPAAAVSSSSAAPAVQPASSSSATPAYAASRREREKARKKRSPLRRAHSSFDGVDDEADVADSGSELFL